MTLQQLVEALDGQILEGDIMGAFSVYAADNCVTLSGPDDITRSKEQKMEALRWFFDNVARVNRIDRLSYGAGDGVTFSEFTFDFTNRHGRQVVFHEVIRRRWQDGKVVEEKYFTAVPTDAIQASSNGHEAGASAQPSESMDQASEMADQAPAKAGRGKKSSAKADVASSDDLVIIEGIGPKIAELLHKNGITTFAQLAETQVDDLRAILEGAGKRYQIHDPATWPEQAALARDGKNDELAELQETLKAGKK